MGIENIGFDVDDTVFDLQGKYFLGEIYKITGPFTPIVNPENGYITVPKMSRGDLSKLVYRLLEKNMMKFEPMENAKLVLSAIQSVHKNKIVFISARPKHLETATKNWIEKKLGIDAIVHCVGNAKKSEFVKAYSLKYFVDDQKKQVEEINGSLGTTCFFMKKYENLQIPRGRNIITCDNLKEVLKYWSKFENKRF